MKDETKDQFVKELMLLRQRAARLEEDNHRLDDMVETLRKSEESYRAFIQCSSEAFCRFESKPIPTSLSEDEVIDLMYRHARLVECNDAFARMDGKKKAEDLIGLQLADVLPRTSPRNGAFLLSFIRSGYRIQNVESYETDDEGNLRCILNSGFGVIENGHLIRAWGVRRDISELKQAEHALKQSEQETQLILDRLAEHVVFTDTKMKIIWPNKAACDSLGIEREQLIGRYCYELWGQWHEPCPDCVVVKAIVSRKTHQIENTTPDGRTWFNTGYPVVDNNGEVVGGIEVSFDISDRKQANEALRTSEQKYRFLVNDINDGFFMTDGQGILTFANKALAKIHGFDTPDELVGRHFLDFVAPTARAKFGQLFAEALSEGTILKLMEVPIVRKDGEVGHAEIKPTVVFENGRAVLTQGVLRDVTERKRTEEELRKARDELEYRVEERTTELLSVNAQLLQEIVEHQCTQVALTHSEKELRFLSSRLLEVQEEERKRIARELHDSIGQSLAAIKFNVENLLQGGGTRNAETLTKPLATLVPIIQGTIEEARRIYTGLRPSVLDDLGIQAAIRWFCREFRKSFPHIRVDEQIDVAEDEVPEPLKIVMFRVLQEALNNVAKYSDTQEVKITLVKAGNTIELAIKDNGRGFDLKEVLSRNAHEKGLGLTGMRERTELSGGAFFVESLIGRGTNIRALWPGEPS